MRRPVPLTLVRVAGGIGALAGALAVGCAGAATGTEAAEIVTGAIDTGHPAVVMLQMETRSGKLSLCTGTMVAATPSTRIGYVLTAAHCVGDAKITSVLAGNDLGAPTGVLTYAPVDVTVHPQYDGFVASPYDVAMVRVTGVDATTATLPYAASDELVAGVSRVTSVGFGTTVRPGQGFEDRTTVKNRIEGTVTELAAAQVAVTYDADGDFCHGDSGGPVIARTRGKDVVVAVHSFVTGACEGAGHSVRTAYHDAFFRSVLAKGAPAASCGLCRSTVSSGNGICVEARIKCASDAGCDGLRGCLDACSEADGGDCRKACRARFPLAGATYDTLVANCACAACADACAGDAECVATPACGVAVPGATCNACAEGACCAELAACGSDGACARCAADPSTSGCAENALYQRLSSCRSTSCAAQCAP